MSAYSQQSRNVWNTWILVFVFIGLVSSVFYVIGIYQGSLVWPIIGLTISLAQAMMAFFVGDKIALSVSRAKQVSYDDTPKIMELVQNLSKIADIPMPKVHISPDKSANAFATGRNPRTASIVLNQGILDY
jgi:heat shock protein HtpX